MKCLICNSDANIQVKSTKWVEMYCSGGCGNFRISTDLAKRLYSIKNGFDISNTRAWLVRARLEKPVPQISGYDYSVALLEKNNPEI
ncbi:hypothetical protein ACIP66_02875 [Pseudomonas sp. NPDC088429]|uniref:hypothetical protein n=1 Tax=Pseudomonas sp. NPDC088429 TaxID=3364455 RepID=UPI003816AB53